jgi:hypothetical protein
MMVNGLTDTREWYFVKCKMTGMGWWFQLSSCLYYQQQNDALRPESDITLHKMAANE